MKAKYKAAVDIDARMLDPKSKERPTCGEILKEKELWALNQGELEIDEKMKSNSKFDDNSDKDSNLFNLVQNHISDYKIIYIPIGIILGIVISRL